MAITIHSNAQLLSQLFAVDKPHESAFPRIFSGFGQVAAGNQGGDKPSAFAIALNFSSQSKAFNSALSNASDGISLAQTGVASLTKIDDYLLKIRDLAVQAQDMNLDDVSRQNLQDKAQGLRGNISLVSENTTFNNNNILAENQQLDFQVGLSAAGLSSINTMDIDKAIADTGLITLDFSTAATASDVLTEIDASLNLVAQQRSAFSEFQFTLIDASGNLSNQLISGSGSGFSMPDSRFSKQSASLIFNQFQQQSGFSVQVQANVNQALVNQLLA
ncbi:MAG: hypothetical protein HRU20_19015 [Pseudomonadales bacterium]|nr:hypothetical protein [Pseudomonadales bacterium]